MAADPPTDEHGAPITYEGDAEQRQDIVVQERPRETRCPECGAKPDAQDLARHILSDVGYAHDDQVFECPDEDCDTEWSCGVPVGEFEYGDDLWCPSCEGAWVFVHRTVPRAIVENGQAVVTGATLHVKCDNCNNFSGTIHREADERGRILTGYPPITGMIEGCEPHGYPESGFVSGESGAVSSGN